MCVLFGEGSLSHPPPARLHIWTAPIWRDLMYLGGGACAHPNAKASPDGRRDHGCRKEIPDVKGCSPLPLKDLLPAGLGPPSLQRSGL